MVKLTLRDKKYQFPERLTLAEWKALLPFDYRDVNDWPKILACCLKEPVEAFQGATLDSLTLAISFVIALMNQREEYRIKDFNEIRFGEFVDLDIYTVEGIEKRLEETLGILCETPPQMADEALWCIDRFQLFRTHIYRSYAVLFGLNEERDFDDEEEPKWDAKKIAKGWYRIIVDLAGDDLLKIDAVTEQPLKQTLNFMALKKEKQLEENFRLLQQKREYDLSRNRK